MFLPLMQRHLPTIESSSGAETKIVILVIVLIVAIVFISNKFSSKVPSGSSKHGKKTSSNSKHVKFKKGQFVRKAKTMGLSKYEIKTLISLVAKYGAVNPDYFFSSEKQIDNLLKRALKDIDSESISVEQKEIKKSYIFRIKQSIENVNNKSNISYTTTSKILPEQPFVILFNNNRFQSKICSNTNKFLLAEIPINGDDVKVKLNKSSVVQIFYWKRNGTGYSFNSKVLGYTNQNDNPRIILQHSNRVKKSQQRRFRRKETNKPAYFYPVQIIPYGSGRKTKKRAVVGENRGNMGTLIDISAGGCAIRANQPIPKGGLIKLQFETPNGDSVICFGKVINFQKMARMGGTMHIVFTKVTHKNLNFINSFVYDY